MGCLSSKEAELPAAQTTKPPGDGGGGGADVSPAASSGSTSAAPSTGASAASPGGQLTPSPSIDQKPSGRLRFSDLRFKNISEERKKQLIHASGDVMIFALRFSLSFIPGAGPILELALPVAGFAITRGKIALANRVGSKKALTDGGDQPADVDEGGPQTLDDAAAKVKELQVQPREALAIMYEQGQLTAQQYEAVLAAICASEAEQAEEARAAEEKKRADEENQNTEKPPSNAEELAAMIKQLAEEMKGVNDTATLVSKTQEVIKRRTRTCGICGAPGVDRRSHKAGHPRAHLHDLSKVEISKTMPPSPKTPAPVGNTSSENSESDKKTSHCSICGKPGVNATSHKPGHEKAHLHDFSKDDEVSSKTPSSPKTPAPVGKTSSENSGDSNQKTPHCGICGAPGVNARSHDRGHEHAHLHDFSKDKKK